MVGTIRARSLNFGVETFSSPNFFRFFRSLPVLCEWPQFSFVVVYRGCICTVTSPSRSELMQCAKQQNATKKIRGRAPKPAESSESILFRANCLCICCSFSKGFTLYRIVKGKLAAQCQKVATLWLFLQFFHTGYLLYFSCSLIPFCSEHSVNKSVGVPSLEWSFSESTNKRVHAVCFCAQRASRRTSEHTVVGFPDSHGNREVRLSKNPVFMSPFYSSTLLALLTATLVLIVFALPFALWSSHRMKCFVHFLSPYFSANLCCVSFLLQRNLKCLKNFMQCQNIKIIFTWLCRSRVPLL